MSARRRSALPSPLITAYRRAAYRVHGPAGPFALILDQPNAALMQLYRETARHSATLITAFNPRGQARPLWPNRRAQTRLMAWLDREGLPHLPASGRDRARRWAAEPSRLVLGLSCAQAIALAARFEQNAVLHAETDAVPRLQLLR